MEILFMGNYELEIKGKILTIMVDLTKTLGPSKSGKTILVASSNGNVSLPEPYEDVKLGLNIYKKE
jgi:hypothetical protein